MLFVFLSSENALPWKVFKKDDKYCVHKLTPEGEKGEEVTCHDSEDSAMAQMRALYAKANVMNAGRAHLFPNAFRAIKQGGKEYLVVPGIPVREQVMNSYLVPADEIARSVKGWNGTAISIHHPHLNDGSVNVPDPDVAIIGRFYHAQWDDGTKRMSGEYWIDLAEAERFKEGKAVVEAIRANKILETSTGYFADDELTPGLFEGKEYKTIHRNLLPDHIAILPNAVGACSIHDGCGVNRNIKLNECDCDCPFRNESLDDKLNQIQAAFQKEFAQPSDSANATPSPTYLWVRKTFDDYVIVEDGADLYQVNYGKDTEGNPIFDPRDKWQKVKLLEEYAPVNAEGGYLTEEMLKRMLNANANASATVNANQQLPDYQADHLPRVMLEGYAFNKGVRTPEQLEGLRAHIAESGIDKPVIIMRKADGEIKILDGNHRVALAHEFNIDQIPVKIVGEDLQPIDPEMMYREWQHQQDQGYLNAILNGDGTTGGTGAPDKSGAAAGTLAPARSAGVSKKLQDAIRAAGKAMKDGEGAADALEKAAGLAKAEGHTAVHKKLMEKAATYRKPAKNVQSRHDLPAALKKKGVTMNLEELNAKLKGRGVTITANEKGEFEVEETQTPVSEEAPLSAEDIATLKALAAKVTPETVQNLESLKDVPAAVKFAQNIQAQEDAEKEQLIATIKTNSANPYSDEELKAMPKGILAKLNAQMNVSFAGLGGAQVFTNTAEAPLGLRPILLAPIASAVDGGK